MKLRKYKVYWTEHYLPKKNGNLLQLPKHKKIVGILSDGVVRVEACKEIRARNIDELIDILRETMVDEKIDVFTVVNPEGISILTETDLINRRYKMAKFRVSYREEFEKTIEAENIEEAVNKFMSGSNNYQLVGELHDCFIEVFDKNGNEIYQE